MSLHELLRSEPCHMFKSIDILGQISQQHSLLMQRANEEMDRCRSVVSGIQFPRQHEKGRASDARRTGDQRHRLAAQAAAHHSAESRQKAAEKSGLTLFRQMACLARQAIA